MTDPPARPSIDDLALSPFGPIIDRLKRSPVARRIPLHQGKTCFSAPIDLRPWEASEFDYAPHHDGPPQGANSLLERLRASLEQRLDRIVPIETIQVTNGITHGLRLVFDLLLEPGDEVVILSPQWLFARGLVIAARGNPVELAYFTAARDTSAPAVKAQLAEATGPRTRAIYFNTPNNPTGLSLRASELTAIADFARERGLFLVSDNAYEIYDYSIDGFIDPAAANQAPDICFSAYSFSKSFGYTGFRIGYLVSPPSHARQIQALSLHSLYSVSTASQFVAYQALGDQAATEDVHRRRVKTALDLTRTRLEVPHSPAEGGFYTALDLGGYEGGVARFLRNCIDRGVSLAPGSAFGDPDSVRLCFTVVERDALEEGLDVINAVYRSG